MSDPTPAMTILIVEDNERNLKLVRDILQYNGYETIEARNAADGVALAAEHRPDLILMDIQLPDVDGVTALSRLRADPPDRLDRRRCLDSVRDDRRPPSPARGRLRRLPGEADRRQGIPRSGVGVAALDAARRQQMNRVARLLIVDDSPQNIRLLDAVLSPRGYAVLPAASGREALSKARSEDPDLVLLDVVMPEMDGYEVCRRLREDPATRLLPGDHDHGQRRP